MKIRDALASLELLCMFKERNIDIETSDHLELMLWKKIIK